MTSLDRVIAAAEAVLPHFQGGAYWNGRVSVRRYEDDVHFQVDFLGQGARSLQRLDAPGPTWGEREVVSLRDISRKLLGGRMLLLLQPDMQGRVRAMPHGPELIASMEAWLNAEGRENFTVLGAST
jgi:hypothetical protein